MQQPQSGQTVQMREMHVLIHMEALVQVQQEVWQVQLLWEEQALQAPLTHMLAELHAWREQLPRTWGEQMVSVQTWAEVQAEAEANGADANVVTYGEVLADLILMVIISSIEPNFHHHLAHDLWPSSYKYWWFIQIIAPISGLPQELLQQILLIIINNASDPPFVLM